ncbi:MAG: hypothetical protein V1815_02895 [Candidatus Woesearchaeota archaeon]
MPIIQTKCWVQKPVDGYYKDCFAIFGIEFQDLIGMVLASLIVGFFFSLIIYKLYCKIKDIKFKTRVYLILSLIISLIIFVVFNILRIIWESNIIY